MTQNPIPPTNGNPMSEGRWIGPEIMRQITERAFAEPFSAWTAKPIGTLSILEDGTLAFAAEPITPRSQSVFEVTFHVAS